MRTIPMKAPRGWRELEPHPLSKLTEFGSGIDVDALANSIIHYGYDKNEPIIIFDGMILDGRHRLLACIKAKVEPNFATLAPGVNPSAYVRKKLFRQHLTESQRAMLAATLATATVGKPVNRSLETTITDQVEMTNLEAAEAAGVSESSVDRAKKVTAHGSPKLQEQVKSGKTGLLAAAKTVTEQICDRCKRIGRVKECLACFELQESAKAKKKATEPKPPKIGEPLFDLKGFKTTFSRLAVQVDALANAYGMPKGEVGRVRLQDMLGDWFKEFEAYHKKLLGEESAV